MQSKDIKTIYLPSSKISSLCGNNHFNTFGKALIEVLQKYNKNIYDKLCYAYNEDNYKYKNICQKIVEDLGININKITGDTYKKKYDTLCLELPEILITRIEEEINSDQINKNKIDQKRVTREELITNVYDEIKSDYENKEITSKIINSDKINKNDVNKLKNNINEIIVKKSQTIPNVNDIEKDLVRRVQMERGNVKEKQAIDIAIQKYKINIIVDNRHLSTKTSTPNKNLYTIGGRVDGFFTDQNDNIIGIVEIKTRKNGFNGRENMPLYDLDQLATYYYLLPYFDKYAICEYYNGDVDLTYYTKDFLSNRWEGLKNILDNVIDYVYDIYNYPYRDEVYDMIKNYTY